MVWANHADTAVARNARPTTIAASVRVGPGLRESVHKLGTLGPSAGGPCSPGAREEAPIPDARRIPEATVARLPLYYRALLETADAEIGTVSSERLAELAGVNAAKVRKDLSFLGSYGTRGVGYDVEYLLHEISRELGLTHDWPVAI